MAEGFKNMIINAILVGLFFVAIVSFLGVMSLDNDIDDNIYGQSTINATLQATIANLTDGQAIAENQSLSQDSNKPIALFDFLFESIIGAGKIFKGLWKDFYNIFFTFIQEQLGIPDVVLYTFTSIILILVILFAWRLWKTGN